MRAGAFALCFAVFGCAEAAPTAHPPNFLVISMDTTRADRLGVLGNTRGLTPNLDAFAKDATVFSSAWSQANTTAMSHASLFTSRYPSELGPTGPKFTLGADGTTMAEVLAAYGYDTTAFTGGLHLSRGWGLERGFAEFHSTGPLGSFWHTLPAAAQWLAARPADKTYFLFVHGYDAHAPYLDPAPYGTAWTNPAYAGRAVNAVRRRIGTELVFDGRLFRDDSMLGFLWGLGRPRPRDTAGRQAVAAAAADGAHPNHGFGAADARYTADVYDGAVAYGDALFGWFWQKVAPLPAMRDTVVVVLSDHGEALGEDGRFGHGDALTDAELHVPLVVRVPGGVGRRVEADVGLLDVLPTLLDYADAKLPAATHGQSLRGWVDRGDGPDDRVVFSEGSLREVSVRDHTARLSFTGLSAHSPWLPGLLTASTDADPAWSLDSTATTAPERAALRTALSDWRAGLRVHQEATALDPKLIQEAKDHGYFTP